jgi:hypothetical protein
MSAGTEIFYMMTTGKVGIGTTAPGYTLDIGGTLNTRNLYIAGTQVTALAVNLNLLTGMTNPLLHAYTNFGGDVTGFYNNLQIGATTVGSSELVDTGITAATYGNALSGTTGYYPTFTVDADGRLTQASTIPFSFENPLTFGNGITRSSNSVSVSTGVGLTTTGGNVQVNLATGGTTTTTSSVSGLEATSAGLRLLGGCSANQLLSWNGSTWGCNTLSGLGIAQIGADTTPNYLTKWSGAGAITSSILYETGG